MTRRSAVVQKLPKQRVTAESLQMPWSSVPAAGASPELANHSAEVGVSGGCGYVASSTYEHMKNGR